MSSQKPLLCPWLIEQVDSGQYPGLCWVNEEKRQFRIPWKHCLRQNISADDVKIFEAWAIASGRYKPGTDVPNPPIWKRNFRCALARKKHFRKVLDNRNDPHDPHLVYEIQSQEAGGITDGEEDDSSSMMDAELALMAAPSNTRTLENSLSDLRIFDPLTGHSIQSPLERGLAVNIPCRSLVNALPPTDPTPAPVLDVTVKGAQALQPPLEDPNIMISSTTLLKAQMEEWFPDRMLATEFEVSIYYRGRKIREEVVGNTNGLRLSYSSQSAFPYLQDVWFPGTDSTPLIDHQQIKYTNQLLERVDQGLALEVQNNLISAQRYGRCKVFWSLEQTPTSTKPQEVSNKSFTVLYGLAEFNKELYAFLNSHSGSPQFSIWLCFGELWPDPNGKPWNKKMIMVQVTPVCFRLLHELALGNGVSSLKSDEMNLQISDHLSTTSLLSILEEYMDIN
ncbi:interferon regulatory factor 3 isoform X2 [Narcine bancroftii]